MTTAIYQRFPVLVLALLLTPAICRADSASADAGVPITDLNNAAHYLAGMAAPHPDADSAKYFESSAWRSHKTLMQKEWTRYEKSRLDPMSVWAAAETVPHTRKAGVVRYMFSGPDILHARRMFPEASTYIMCGLEPPGPAPDLDRLDGYSAASALAQIRKALEDSLRLSFFITKDMQRELPNARFAGTFPIITLYLARLGLPVRAYEYLDLKDDGSLVSLGSSSKGATGFRIEAGRSAKDKIDVYYFRVDLGNDGVAKSGFLEFLEKLPPGGAYLKAASYIPHSSYFSKITNHLLARTRVLVQDDSGVPLRHFKGDTWELTHYGTYTRPISLFSNNYQANLRQAYRGDGVKPLNFGTGYKYRLNESNLMLAVRKDGPATPKSPVKPVIVAAAAAAAKAMPAKVEQNDAPKQKATASAKSQDSPKTKSKVKPASDSPPSRASGPVTVTVTLRKAPSMAEAQKKSGNVLGIFEYEVVDVQRGDYSAKTIRVAHGVIWSGRQTRAATRQPGTTVSLALVPLTTYPRLVELPQVGGGSKQDDGTIFIPALD